MRSVARTLWLLLVACAPGRGEDEVAAEVRALRQALLVRPAAASAPDHAAATAALSPLREALQGLVGNQQELQQRQLALTQEMQRWSTLLVQHGNQAQREETATLSARLQQLEASLLEQDARHREMQQLLQGALDRTADRLGEFLRGVGVDPEPEPAAPPSVAPDATPAPPSSPENRSARTGAIEPRARPTITPWWWGGIAGLTVIVGAVCWRRLRHAPPLAARRTVPAGVTGATPGVPTGDPDVQEIWAAAALLGEAVGRLRESAPTTEPVPAGDDGLVGDAPDDLIVLDDELLASTRSSAESRTGPAAPPEVATCRLRTADPSGSLASVLRILQEDPRVLRRPEPAVRCARDCLEASFRLVPDLPPGERSHLEQRLRDACGSPS